MSSSFEGNDVEASLERMGRDREPRSHTRQVQIAFDIRNKVLVCTPEIFSRLQCLVGHPDEARYKQWLDTTGWLMGLDFFTFMAVDIASDIEATVTKVER